MLLSEQLLRCLLYLARFVVKETVEEDELNVLLALLGAPVVLGRYVISIIEIKTLGRKLIKLQLLM